MDTYYISKNFFTTGPFTVSEIEEGLKNNSFTDDFYIIEACFYELDKTVSFWHPITERASLLNYQLWLDDYNKGVLLKKEKEKKEQKRKKRKKIISWLIFWLICSFIYIIFF